MVAIKTNWTAAQTTTLLEVITDYIREKGVVPQSGFKAQHWTEFQKQFQSRASVAYSKDVLQNKYSDLKKKFAQLSAVLDESVFGVTFEMNDETGVLVDVDAQVWAEYTKSHPDRAWCRTKKLDNFELLKGICTGTVSNNYFSPSIFS